MAAHLIYSEVGHNPVLVYLRLLQARQELLGHVANVLGAGDGPANDEYVGAGGQSRRLGVHPDAARHGHQKPAAVLG